jgi:hypothetical protein
MKKLMAVIAVVVAFAFGAALAAAAEQCPLLIKELKERVDKLSDHNYKKERAQRLITEAQKLYDEGKPDDCVKKCEETATSLR